MNHSLFLLAGLGLLTLNACSTTAGKSASHTASQALSGPLTQAEAATKRSLQSAEDRQAYAAAVSQVVAAWQSQSDQPTANPAFALREGATSWKVTVSWAKTLRFDELTPVIDPKKRQLTRQVLREGVGTPFVALWQQTPERKETDPFLSEGGYMAPVTVTLDLGPTIQGVRQARLRVHDPRENKSIQLAGRSQPVAADWSAVSEHILVSAKEQKVMPGLAALRDSQKYLDKLGLISLEPPSRDRIPVIFVHGLMSRPLTWHNAFNELSADPEIQKNYQLYFFRYPSGVPVIYSSAKFRQQLSLLEQELARVGNRRGKGNMVLIGHSMGGLVSKLQVQSSGDRLWVNVFGAKPADLGLTAEELANFKQYLEFNPNPHVHRVIFVCTPHRGSKLAEGFVGAIGRRLISLPTQVLGNTFDLLQGKERSNPVLAKMLAKGVPSSLENLSPESTFVKQSIQIPLKPGLHVHSIIGNKDGRPLTDPKCSDGVVPYTSAHLDGVESELVVKSNHGAHETEEGIAEMRRILLLHLK
jgi:hypothetical protein